MPFQIANFLIFSVVAKAVSCYELWEGQNVNNKSKQKDVSVSSLYHKLTSSKPSDSVIYTKLFQPPILRPTVKLDTREVPLWETFKNPNNSSNTKIDGRITEKSNITKIIQMKDDATRHIQKRSILPLIVNRRPKRIYGLNGRRKNLLTKKEMTRQKDKNNVPSGKNLQNNSQKLNLKNIRTSEDSSSESNEGIHVSRNEADSSLKVSSSSESNERDSDERHHNERSSESDEHAPRLPTAITTTKQPMPITSKEERIRPPPPTVYVPSTMGKMAPTTPKPQSAVTTMQAMTPDRQITESNTMKTTVGTKANVVTAAKLPPALETTTLVPFFVTKSAQVATKKAQPATPNMSGPSPVDPVTLGPIQNFVTGVRNVPAALIGAASISVIVIGMLATSSYIGSIISTHPRQRTSSLCTLSETIELQV